MAKTTRNPQDATVRNIRALKKRVARCEARLDMLESAIAVNATLWKAWSAQVRKPPRRRSRTAIGR